MTNTASSPRARVGKRPWQALAKLHDWARTLEPEWQVAWIKFQREPEKVVLHGTEWRFQMSIGGATTEDGLVVYTAQIIMSACDRPPGRTGMRKQKAVYSEVARTLRPLGYSAAWYGSFGLIQGAFESLGVLRQGVKRIRSLALVSPSKRGAAEQGDAADKGR